MKPTIAPCGFRCDWCVAFKTNARTHADRVRGSATWARYWHLQVAPQRIVCDGCLSGLEGPLFRERNACRIRPCVLGRGLETCAECADYPCKMLERRMAACDEVVAQFKGKIPAREYERSIAPYDCRTILEGRRKGK